MITENKSKKNQSVKIAGLLPKDDRIEFAGIHETKEVLWMRNGNVHRWEDLPNDLYGEIWKVYHKDKGARAELQQPGVSLDRQIELYIYYMYGDIDSTPDMVNGKLQPSENFRCTENCISLGFDNKTIDIDGVELTAREIKIVDMIKADMPDKAIAAELPNRNGKKGISIPTYNIHKRNLFHKIRAKSRVETVVKSLNAGI